MKRIVATAALLTLLAGCGGNGNNDDNDSPATTALAQGPITKFGSLFVDGVEYDVSGASILNDGVGITQADLAPGQVVSVGGTVDADGHHDATIVTYRATLRGPVDVIYSGERRIGALGQIIQVNDATVLAGIATAGDFAIGDTAEVSGYRTADGVIVASFLGKRAGGTTQLRGQVSGLDTANDTFVIEGETIDFTGATVTPSGQSLAEGDFVVVQGTHAGTTLTATEVAIDDGFGAVDNGVTTADVSIRGLVDTVAAGSFTVGAHVIATNGSTTYEDGAAADLAPGAGVHVDGARQADGSIVATHVAFDPDPDSQGQLLGVVEATSADGLTVMGVPLVARTSTVYRDPRDETVTFGLGDVAVGDRVQAGFNTRDGVLELSLLERVDPGAPSQATGQVDTFDATAKTMVIGGVDIDASTASFTSDGDPVDATAFFADLSAGDRVLARGTFAGGVLTANVVSRQSVVAE